MPLTIATWNINSVRLRIDNVISLLKREKPDVLCLQETKCPDELFPHLPFEAAGYKYRLTHGMKGYNGVAIISRVAFTGSAIHHRAGKQDCRHIAVQLATGNDPLELHNLYVPAGGDIPDRAQNVKFAHKLDFMAELGQFFTATAPKKGARKGKRRVMVGDINIAPLEHDVWSHKQLLDVVSHTPIEVELFTKMQRAQDWHDVPRRFVPASEKLYSWWSYRNQDWRKSDRGRRLDHILASPALAPLASSYRILKDLRDRDKASDHVPVLASFAI